MHNDELTELLITVAEVFKEGANAATIAIADGSCDYTDGGIPADSDDGPTLPQAITRYLHASESFNAKLVALRRVIAHRHARETGLVIDPDDGLA